MQAESCALWALPLDCGLCSAGQQQWQQEGQQQQLCSSSCCCCSCSCRPCRGGPACQWPQRLPLLLCAARGPRALLLPGLCAEAAAASRRCSRAAGSWRRGWGEGWRQRWPSGLVCTGSSPQQALCECLCWGAASLSLERGAAHLLPPSPTFPFLLQCKHLLAVTLAEAMGPARFKQKEVSDEELTLLLTAAFV